MTAAQVQEAMAVYNDRHTFARRNTRRISGGAYKYGVPFEQSTNSDPIRVKPGNFLAGIRMHCHGTMAFSQPIGAGAVTRSSFGPDALITNLALIGEEEVTPVSMSSFAAKQFEMLAKKGDYVDTDVFGYPGANGTGAVLNTNETVDFWREFLNVHDLIDLLGIQNVNNDQINLNTQLNFGNAANSFVLPNGTTATFTGVVDLYAIRFRANLQGTPGPDFSKFFNQLAITRSTALTTSEVDIPVNYKNWITRMLVHVYSAPNTLDATNSLGLTNISVTASNGQVLIKNYDLSDLINQNSTDYGAAWQSEYAGKGAYVIEFSPLREYLDGFKYTDLTLTLTFGAAPGAGATASVYLQGLVNTNPLLPLFM